MHELDALGWSGEDDGVVTDDGAAAQRGKADVAGATRAGDAIAAAHRALREIDATGKVLWKYDRPSACFATRLPSGNTLVVDNSFGLVEVTREGKVVAEKKISTSLWRVRRR